MMNLIFELKGWRHTLSLPGETLVLSLYWHGMLLFQQLTKDKKSLEDKLQETNQALADEEEKAKGLAKQKAKQDALIADLEERLRNSEKVGNELVQRWYWVSFFVNVKVSVMEIPSRNFISLGVCPIEGIITMT